MAVVKASVEEVDESVAVVDESVEEDAESSEAELGLAMFTATAPAAEVIAAAAAALVEAEVVAAALVDEELVDEEGEEETVPESSKISFWAPLEKPHLALYPGLLNSPARSRPSTSMLLPLA